MEAKHVTQAFLGRMEHLHRVGYRVLDDMDDHRVRCGGLRAGACGGRDGHERQSDHGRGGHDEFLVSCHPCLHVEDRYRNRAYSDHLASLSVVTRPPSWAAWQPLGLQQGPAERRALAGPNPGAAVRPGQAIPVTIGDMAQMPMREPFRLM